MALVKAHIILEPAVGGDEKARTAAFTRLLKAAQISQINQKRFDRYGILTGLVEESALEKLRHVQGIQTVELDQERSLR